MIGGGNGPSLADLASHNALNNHYYVLEVGVSPGQLSRYFTYYKELSKHLAQCAQFDHQTVSLCRGWHRHRRRAQARCCRW